MEKGFNLPEADFKKSAIPIVVGYALATSYAFYTAKSIYSASFISIELFILVFVLGLLYYAKNAKWVYVSELGISGHSKFARITTLDWHEKLDVKAEQSNGFKGRILKSQATGKSVFIPNCILESVEFQTELLKYTSQNHPLLGMK